MTVSTLIASIFVIGCERKEEFTPKRLVTRSSPEASAKHGYVFWPIDVGSSDHSEASATFLAFPRNGESGQFVKPVEGKFILKIAKSDGEEPRVDLQFIVRNEKTSITISKDQFNSNGTIENLAFVHSGQAQIFRLRCEEATCKTVHICFPSLFRERMYCPSTYRFRETDSAIQLYKLASMRIKNWPSTILTSSTPLDSMPDSFLENDCPDRKSECVVYNP